VSMKLVRLLEWRRRRGLSQAELSELSGVARDAISKYEGLKREAQPGSARRLAEALGVEVEELLYSARVERPAWGRETGNVLRGAREHGGFEEELALLRRFAEEVDGTSRSMYETYQREAEFRQALQELDVRKMPGRAGSLVRSYMELAGNLAASGVRVPVGLARTLVEALERESARERREPEPGGADE
jgi:transcriptional regulator with XRE-family HTH domain